MPDKTASTTIRTDKAPRYLQALCGHFSRKVKSDWSETEGRVDFGFGHARMDADEETLVLHVQAATEEELERVKHVVGDHLERFAAKDGLKAVWTDAVQTPQQSV